MAMLCPIISVAQNSVTDTLSIKETVFVGFTNQKSVNLTGAVIQVDMNEVLGDRPITSIGAALQGAVPGLSISGKSTPGQFKSVNIRGQLSINGGSPLVLIDNVETDLNMLNPEDIESISVLKDAASAAIYGARAAGGVILITTKRPKGKEKFKLDYSFKLGFNQCLSSPKQASLSQYIDAYEEAGFSSQYWAGGGQVSRWKELLGLYSKGGLAGVYDNGIFKDEDGAVYFLKERDVLGSALEIGVLNSHNIAVSGGTDRVRYRLSGNYSHENGPMVSTKDSYKRYSLNSFISADITGWFTQEASLIYTHENRSDIQTTFRDPYSTKLINWYPEGYMPGEIIGREEDVLIDSPLNACLYSPAATSWTSTPRISLKSILKPLKGWSIIAEYTYQQKNFAYKEYSGQQEIADAQLSTRIIPAAEQDKYTHNTRNNAYNALNIYSNYNLSINGHNLNVTLGYNQESNKDNWILNSVLNQAVITVPSLQGGRGIRTSEETLTEYSTMGFFGRIAYNWKGRYLIEMNARYDGSSKFPKVNRFGFFPSVSGAWRISEEPDRDKGNAPWTAGYDEKTNYEVAPLLWEIRRERIIELMGRGFSFYDVCRWHKAPYFVNRQPCGAWIKSTGNPYGTGAYTGQFVDYNEIKLNGQASPNKSGSGWIYTYPSPLAAGKGWLDKYYLEQVPLDQIGLNPSLTQNTGYEE